VTNTHPRGAWLPPLDVVVAMLGFTNLSFVARTVDWNPLHLYQTLELAHRHRGLSCVHILQRCPAYTAEIFEELQRDPDRILLLTHDDGVPVDAAVGRLYKNRHEHDPSDLEGARRLAEHRERVPIGLFYRNPEAPVYDDFTGLGLGMSDGDKLATLERELDRFAI
jgi:2-oxoglutarate ferredoxin oxidoreductase subunit beta